MTLDNDTSDIQAGVIGDDVVDAISQLPAGLLGEFDDQDRPIEDDDEQSDARGGEEEKPSETETKEGGEEEEQPKVEDKEQSEDDEGKADETAASDEDYVEVPSEEEGGEPTRIPVSELLDAHNKMRSFNGDVAGVRSQLETAFAEKMTPVLQEQMKVRDDYIKRYEKVREWSPVGQPPDPEVYLNPQSEHYDPQQWELVKAQYERRKAAWDKADAEMEQEKTKLEADQKAMMEETHKRERAQLLQAWPELQSEKGGELWNGLYQDIQQHYGMSPDELNQVTDHRAFVMARDAIAYRKMKADKGAGVKKAAAAKLVKGKAKPAAADTGKRGQGRTKLADDLRKTGDIHTGAELIKGLL